MRADLVTWLCVDEKARQLAHWRGIQVFGADVIRPLDLSFVRIPFQLAFRHCRLKDGINLENAELSQIDLQGSLVNGVSADGINVKSSIFLSNGFASIGRMRLRGAQIGGILDCSYGSFTNPPQKDVKGSGTALSADRINVKGSVFLRGVKASGKVGLLGAQIGGILDCSDGTFANPPQKDLLESGDALSADRINVKDSVFLNGSFTATGEVRLLGAHVGGKLEGTM